MKNKKQIQKRAKAMAWWNSMCSGQKTQICDTNINLVGTVRRWETLTGSEIQSIYENERNYEILDTINPDERSEE